MNFCTEYSNRIEHIEKFDEIIIQFQKNKLVELFEQYIPEHQEQRIILAISTDDLDLVLKILDERKLKNITLQLNKISNKEIKVPFFYSEVATDLDTMYAMIDGGACEVRIGGELGFRLKDVKTIADNHNIKLRCVANVASSYYNLKEIYRFWIRPEDINRYSKYIDTFELIASNGAAEKLLEIYKEDKKWYGDLREIIGGLEEQELDSRFIIQEFGERRMNCGKKCYAGKCNICEEILKLSGNMRQAGFIVDFSKEVD